MPHDPSVTNAAKTVDVYDESRTVEYREEAVASDVDLGPRNLESWVRILAWCSPRSTFHLASPSSVALAVDPTMSVNITVAKTLSGSTSRARLAS